MMDLKMYAVYIYRLESSITFCDMFIKLFLLKYTPKKHLYYDIHLYISPFCDENGEMKYACIILEKCWQSI